MTAETYVQSSYFDSDPDMGKRWVQQEILAWHRREPIQNTPRLSRHCDACTVIANIGRLHPEISQLSYSLFNPYDPEYFLEWTSDTLTWFPRAECTTRHLIWRSGKHELNDVSIAFSDNKSGPPGALAVNSKVQLHDGWTMHIPQLQFCVAPDAPGAPEMEEIRQLLSGEHGVLLTTGTTMQFWGFDLMGEEEWLDWIRSMVAFELARDDDKDPIVDIGFTDRAIDRGYSSLPLWAYPDSEYAAVPRFAEYVG